jgi:hypothetical protein
MLYGALANAVGHRGVPLVARWGERGGFLMKSIMYEILPAEAKALPFALTNHTVSGGH